MKNTAVLVNTSRGTVIDQTALVVALREGTIRAAAIDVYDPEPPSPGDPLLALPNVTLSPHLAGVTAESLMRILNAAAANCDRLRNGEALHDVIEEGVQH
jgi:D-3-phosphoglycerate dehydrogenase